MNSFPSELLIRVFVLLDPTALSKAQLVCKRWHTVIADERSWRDALLIGLGRLPFLRLQPQSWRREYIDRLNRIRQWKFDRIHSVTFDARIGDLTHTFVEFLDSSMLVGNLTRGLAVPCHITTGKVDNRSAYTSPEMASLITIIVFYGAMKMVVFLQRVSRQQRQRRQILFEHRHVGAVQSSTRLATGGNDGLVHLWEASTGKWIASLNGTSTTTTTTSMKQEIEEEIEHTTQYLKNRRQEAEYQQTLLKTYNNLEGLSDEELLHYTMMLSMEESPSMHSQASSDGNTNTESDEERLLAEREAKDLEDAIRLSMQLK
ncbi:hypothetical protein BDF22DRAFT_669372 [Syncephalis plumigaleata]|nr:hypothetical protein BDF22DRAFT_669372 [Syncephalis plumigaleata]